MVFWWLVVACSSSGGGRHPLCHGSGVLGSRPRVPGPWMPVRSNSRRLGGSLYRWLVVHLFPRRRHLEASVNKHEHRRGGSAPPRKDDPCRGKEHLRRAHNVRSSSPCEGARRKEAKEGGGWGGGVAQHVFTTRGSGEMLTTDSSTLPAIQTVDGSLSAASCALCRRDAAGVSHSRIQLVQEAPAGCRLESPSGPDGAAASLGADERPRWEEASDAQGASGGRTCAQPDSPPGAAQSYDKNKVKGKRGAFPLLNVRGLEQSNQGSVQSLAAPRTCKHINVVRQWDSISVLYGVEYLEVRKKVHERLLCILRARRERRQRREAVEGVGGAGGRPRRHSHRRKRRKRKVKGKHGGKKDGKPPRTQGEVDGECVVAATQDRGVQASQAGSDALRAAESYTKECRELEDLDDGEAACLNDEGAERRSLAAAAADDGEEVKKSKEVFEFVKDEMLAFVRSPSACSGDSRPSKSLSYHKVTSSEKSSSRASSFLGTRATPPVKDLSPGLKAPRSSPIPVPSPTSSSASSSTSSSTTASSASSLTVTSPSVKSTGGLSASIKTVAYISDDESASERRRSALYCCPCFISLRRKAKKSRRR